MKLPARFALTATLAFALGEPALAAIAAAVERPAAVREIGQFFDERQGRAFWFASDNGAEALLALLDQASLDDLDESLYPIATLRRLAANARSGSERDRREAEATFSAAFVQYAGDVARERNVGTLYVDPGARPRPVSAARLLRVAAAAPSLAVYVEQMRWMALSKQTGRRSGPLLTGPEEQGREPVPLLQFVARGDPPGGDDVCSLPAVVEECRGSAVRARGRHLPRDGTALVEPVRAAFR